MFYPVITLASEATATASLGALIAPFGPVPVQHITVVGEVTPVVGASAGHTERVVSGDPATFRRIFAVFAPARWDRTMQIIGEQGVIMKTRQAPVESW